MESFENFKKQQIENNPGLFRSSDSYFRRLYKEEFGAWPGEVEFDDLPKHKKPVRVTNKHGTLDGIAGFISFLGWITVVGGAFLAIAGLVTLDSIGGLGAIGLIYGVAVTIFGLLIVANGQFLKVIGQVELNTQKTALLLEQLLDRSAEGSDEEK